MIGEGDDENEVDNEEGEEGRKGRKGEGGGEYTTIHSIPVEDPAGNLVRVVKFFEEEELADTVLSFILEHDLDYAYKTAI